MFQLTGCWTPTGATAIPAWGFRVAKAEKETTFNIFDKYMVRHTNMGRLHMVKTYK